MTEYPPTNEQDNFGWWWPLCGKQAVEQVIEQEVEVDNE